MYLLEVFQTFLLHLDLENKKEPHRNKEFDPTKEEWIRNEKNALSLGSSLLFISHVVSAEAA